MAASKIDRDWWRCHAVIARFLALHLAALAVFVVPFTPALVAWRPRSYLARMSGVTAGYHRYFGHRSFKLGRGVPFAMAVLGQSSGQKSVLCASSSERARAPPGGRG